MNFKLSTQAQNLNGKNLFVRSMHQENPMPTSEGAHLTHWNDEWNALPEETKEVWANQAKEINNATLNEIEKKKVFDANNKLLRDFAKSSSDRLKAHYLILAYRDNEYQVLGSTLAVDFYINCIHKGLGDYGEYISNRLEDPSTSGLNFEENIIAQSREKKIKFIREALGQKYSNAVPDNEKNRKSSSHVPWNSFLQSDFTTIGWPNDVPFQDPVRMKTDELNRILTNISQIQFCRKESVSVNQTIAIAQSSIELDLQPIIDYFGGRPTPAKFWKFLRVRYPEMASKWNENQVREFIRKINRNNQ